MMLNFKKYFNLLKWKFISLQKIHLKLCTITIKNLPAVINKNLLRFKFDFENFNLILDLKILLMCFSGKTITWLLIFNFITNFPQPPQLPKYQVKFSIKNISLSKTTAKFKQYNFQIIPTKITSQLIFCM